MITKRIRTLRTLETHARYERYSASGNMPACYICGASPTKEYKHWKIIENQFPYDEVATVSQMLVPKRHIKEGGLNRRERREMKEIKPEVHEAYDLVIENTHKQKSIPGHYHLHLLQLKEREITIENNFKPLFSSLKLNFTR